MSLFETAGDDGEISKEEMEIIMSTKIDLKVYFDKLEAAKSKGMITLQEAAEIEEWKNRVVANAGNVIAKNMKITEKEKKLIRKLADILLA